MNAALELGSCPARQDGTSGCWTHLRRTRHDENVARARRLGNEPTEGSCSAFWRRHRITGQRVERRNEAAAKILDLRERVRLSTSVFQSQNGSFINGSSSWIEVPRSGFLGRGDFSDKMRKSYSPVADASSRTERGIERGRVAFVP